MITAYEINAAFKRQHRVDDSAFQEWFEDAGYPQEATNIHDSQYLALIEKYVEERDQ